MERGTKLFISGEFTDSAVSSVLTVVLYDLTQILF